MVLHADHYRPVAAGGETTEVNLVTACSACNAGKGSVLPLMVIPCQRAQALGAMIFQRALERFEADPVQMWSVIYNACHIDTPSEPILRIVLDASTWAEAKTAIWRYCDAEELEDII